MSCSVFKAVLLIRGLCDAAPVKDKVCHALVLLVSLVMKNYSLFFFLFFFFNFIVQYSQVSILISLSSNSKGLDMQFNQSMASLLTIMGSITQPIDTIID